MLACKQIYIFLVRGKALGGGEVFVGFQHGLAQSEESPAAA